MNLLKMKLLKIVLITIVGFLATACSDSKYSGVSDSELDEKQRHCDSVTKKSPVFATGCENVKNEILERKKKK